MGDHLFDKSMRVAKVKAAWKKDGMPTVIHLMPEVINQLANGKACKPKFGPFRDRHDPEGKPPGHGLTDFYYRAAVANMCGVGDNKQTFIVCNVAEHEDRRHILRTPIPSYPCRCN